MLTIDRSTITDGGMTLLNSGNPINITSIKTGSGTYTSSEDIVSRTTLKSQMYSYTPSTVQVDGSSRTVSGLLSNYDLDTDTAIVTSDYTITEVGLFATVNGSDVLFAIGISYDGTEVPAFTGQNKSEIVVEWAMSLSGTDSVTVTATGAPALATDLNTHIGNDVYSANGVHGIRAVDDNGKKKLQVDDNGWKDIDGGHTIVDENGTEFTQRAYLKILNAEITDDSENDTTVVNPQGGTIIVTPPTVVVGTYTYNGSPQGPTITWDTGMSDYCVVTNATQTAAGSYQLTIALKNTAKMVWNDGASGISTADKIYNYSIAKANQTITLSSNSVTLDPNNLTATVTVSGAQGSISATTSDNTIATASVSGSTVTISNVSMATGSATITVTAAATTNYNSDSDTVAVTASFIPNGSTVTPTDDIQTWLKCGGIYDKNYTTLNQVLSDTSTLSALISDSNAVNYMVRSTTWATDTCNNQTAMSYIGLNNYCSNTLLDDNTWLNAICNSSYFESVLNVKVPTMTSNTTPSGVVISTPSNVWYGNPNAPWAAFDGNDNTYAGQQPDKSNGGSLGYMFTSAVSIKCFKVLTSDIASNLYIDANANLEYSTTGSDFTSLKQVTILGDSQSNVLQTFTVPNNIDAQYWRLNWQSRNYYNSGSGHWGLFCSTLQFYGRADV